MLTGIARGFALFFGVFTLMNLAGGAGTNIWWLDLWVLAEPAATALLIALALVMLGFAAAPRAGQLRRAVAIALLSFAALMALVNAGSFYGALARGDIRSHFPLPLSLVMAAVLITLALAHVRKRGNAPRAFAITVVLTALLFPLAQISFFGLTDYRRPADLIVVLGAHAYADGRPSSALEDRIRTGCELYREGLAPRILFSGGPGDGAIDEPEAMRRYAIRHGVPDSAILRDPHGVNTEATVRNTLALANGPRILVVSHFYHLPRIKMAFQRHGVDIYTVPARTSRIGGMPYNLARETAAFWAYYLRFFTTSSSATFLAWRA
jgi:uncharacterized SAM-binding protein YcdF (DUF218 family)